MFEDQVQQLKTLQNEVNENLKALNLPALRQELSDLRTKQSDPALYQNVKKLTSLSKAIKKLQDKIEPWEKLNEQIEDVFTLIEMAREENDEGQENEIKANLAEAESRYQDLELLELFKEESDYHNTYLSLHSGAGGTESCDWTSMLYRMYTRWLEENGFKYVVVDYLAGEEAGIKSVTLFVEGEYAHGYLKCESGVHRLVRMSPFDTNKRRHTSFCSVRATAEIDEDVELDINPSDLRIDTYRASGAGGQHVNTTDSAVRITHLSTEIVVTCQAERSQMQNKERAMKILKARLYEHYRLQKEAEINASAAEKKKIEWGSQIRSYVFAPYTLVKDHRTAYETGNVEAVMDGALSGFIRAYLKKGLHAAS